MTDREHLKNLTSIGNRWRMTPIVDDDFVGLKNEFDHALRLATEQANKLRPTVVCLCGSTRYMEVWQSANLSETLAGRIVLSIGCNTKCDADLQRMGDLTAEKKAELDELHKRKIDLADEIYVLNVNGYVGESTRSEVMYAKKHNKRVRWLDPQAVGSYSWLQQE